MKANAETGEPDGAVRRLPDTDQPHGPSRAPNLYPTEGESRAALLDGRSLLAMQNGAGNAAVAHLLAQRSLASRRLPLPSTPRGDMPWLGEAQALVAPPGSPGDVPPVQRTPYSDVVNAINTKGRIFDRDGDFKTAWGVLNHLSIADMLTTMQALNSTGQLATLMSHLDAAGSFNKARLLVAAHAVQLKARGVDAAGLSSLSGEISAAGPEVEDVERYLQVSPGTVAGPLSGLAPPDAAASATIGGVLNPASTAPVGGPPVAWDGDGSTPKHLAKREELKKEVTRALGLHLAEAMPNIRKMIKAPKLKMTAFEGAGRQAKRLVDDKFGSLASSAALTAGQESGRKAFSFTAGVNLLNQTDPKDYTPDPDDLASWMAETDPRSAAAQLAHHFDKTRSREGAFLKTEILGPFVAKHRADLAHYDAYGFATADPRTHTVRTVPAILGNTKSPEKGVPSPAERAARWGEWETLVHEYIHTLEHPAFNLATQGRRVMTEGFCELFTKAVLTTAIPVAQADGDPLLRGEIEGRDPVGGLFAHFDKSMVPGYDPGSYAAYLAGAEQIQASTSPKSVAAAFFLGHVELIGLNSNGDLKAPPVGPATAVTPPPGVSTVFAVATITGSTSRAILAANPGLTESSPLPPVVNVPGCSYHTVVQSDERRPTGGIMSSAVEGPDKIGAMYGVSADAIRIANPATDWAKVKGGDRILVPAHA